MKKSFLLAAAALALTLPVNAQEAQPDPRSSIEAVAQEGTPAPSPNEIVAAAPASEWVRIAAEDLLVMTLAPDSVGNARTVVIQLMPAPFSQGWVSNIRTFARAKWYDNISVNRVQDNYVVQWGDPNYDNPEATGETKALPEGLKVMGEDDYTLDYHSVFEAVKIPFAEDVVFFRKSCVIENPDSPKQRNEVCNEIENYPPARGYWEGWPYATNDRRAWPVHCYGMVGVGRNYSPDTGSGAELYTVIGHAPRHLDRNIALVGRIIEGMEHLSSLPRGKGDLGFYREDEFDKRTPILSVRVASDLPAADQPAFEYLSTEGETFAKYADARANRRDPFFIVPAGGADICNIPVPVRRISADAE